MEKFSMPEQVSATLEIDETTRLKKSLEATISKEEADRIMSELSLPVNSTPGARAEWCSDGAFGQHRRFPLGLAD